MPKNSEEQTENKRKTRSSTRKPTTSSASQSPRTRKTRQSSSVGSEPEASDTKEMTTDPEKKREIEEKRKRIEAEKLKMQREMERLAEEERMLSGTEQRSGDREMRGRADTELSRDMSYEELDHEPMSDGDNEGFNDENSGGGPQKRSISPVTWDVDLHTGADDQLSVDSPIRSEPSDDGEVDKVEEKKADDSVSNTNSSTNTNNIQPLMQTNTSGAPVANLENDANDPNGYRARLRKYLYREAKYFMVKSNNHENVRLAKAKGVWSTPPQNQLKFDSAIDANTTVILIFSVKESGAFQGFARIHGPSTKDGPRISWVLPPGISSRALSSVFRLDWISRSDVAFDTTMHLRNPWNENKPVKIARDGQEIDPRVGEKLCEMFQIDGSSDYERVISKIKRKREQLTSKGIIPRNNRPIPSAPRGRRPYPASNTRGTAHDRLYNMSRGPPPRDYESPHQPASRAYYYDQRPSPRSSYPPSMGPQQTQYDYNPPAVHATYAGGVSADVIARGDRIYFLPNQRPILKSYDDYLNELRRSGGYLPHDAQAAISGSAYGGYDSGPPPPPIPSSYSASRERPTSRSYDRQVEDFLRYTASRRSPDRRGRDDRRDRRERSRSPRYRERR